MGSIEVDIDNIQSQFLNIRNVCCGSCGILVCLDLLGHPWTSENPALPFFVFLTLAAIAGLQMITQHL